jgi:crossover junction endodeoxyribonuclease RuvC
MEARRHAPTKGQLVKILGLDPGTTATNPTGVALIDWPSGGDPRLLGTAQIAPRPGESLESFLGRLAQRLRGDWLSGVDLLGIEWPYVGKNAQSAMMLAACWGAAQGAAGERGVSCVHIAPTQAKAALTGDGKADKAAMREAVRVQFGVKIPKDQADAVGIALAAGGA